MDVSWPTIQNWALFGAVAGGLAYYYYPKDAKASIKSKTPEPVVGAGKRQNEVRHKQQKNVTSEHPATERESGADLKRNSGSEGKKRSTKKVQVQAPTDPIQVARHDEPEDVDMSTRQFAQQMAQARQGHTLQTTKSKDKRVRTVKQGSALDAQGISSASSQAGGDADDDLSPVASPSLRAGDVANMLEPTTTAPTTLRITGNLEQQKSKKAKKEEVVETKKQRQNREKVERRRIEREEEEKVRKALEEKQRRAAREARGEPAKNGMSFAETPANNAWSRARPAAAIATATENGPLLDTFDAESTASSTGAPGVSTAATSATDGSTARLNGDVSEEEQFAQAVKQSEDESGWQTVNQPKKSKKKGGDTPGAGDSTPVPVVAPVVKKQAPTAQSTKPKGFQVLEVAETQQTAGADPDDLDNWTA